ncbi:hypothetical protein ACGF5M_02070 [Gemmatimonadota bacterium]
MTKSDYQELVEFLGVQFGQIDQRFEKTEERLTRVETRTERLEDTVRLVAEGVSAVDEKLDRFQQEARQTLAGITARVNRLEARA